MVDRALKDPCNETVWKLLEILSSLLQETNIRCIEWQKSNKTVAHVYKNQLTRKMAEHVFKQLLQVKHS